MQKVLEYQEFATGRHRIWHCGSCDTHWREVWGRDLERLTEERVNHLLGRLNENDAGD